MNGQAIQSITVQQLYELSQQQPIELIDVRTPEEFGEVHPVIARNVPMDTVDPQEFIRARGPKDDPIYFVCQMGGRSGRMCLAMMAAGYSNVVNVLGGTEAWEEAGLPVVR